MTELYLKKSDGDWQRVFFESSNSFKLTRENPFFTQSESYTLDVTLPMKIEKNRIFFQSLHRIDRSKNTMVMKCRLSVNHHMYIDGSAKITQVTEKDVKIQLLGGNSEINFLSKENKVYIDEMPMGRAGDRFTFTDYKGETMNLSAVAKMMPVYDETNTRLLNKKTRNVAYSSWSTDAGYAVNPIQPNLMYVIRAVIELSGYTISRCDFNCEPWDHLYIASAKPVLNIANALPHWLTKDFLSEVCSFFNCTMVIDSKEKTVSFIGNKEYINTSERSNIEPIEEYTSELTDEGADVEAVAACNIEYDMSSSSEHAQDCMDNDLRDQIPTRECTDREDVQSTYNSMTTREKKKYVFKCPTGRFVAWEPEDSMVFSLTQIDFFAPLKRYQDNENYKSLKICPVAMKLEDEAMWLVDNNLEPVGYRMKGLVVCLENPTGSSVLSDEDDVTAQDLIEGNADIDKNKKEDRLQVMFVDHNLQEIIVKDGPHSGEKYTHEMPFTDWEYLQIGAVRHNHWSLSLTPTNSDYYLGQLHQLNYKINTKVKNTFKFLSDEIPNPTNLFVARGKLYACEKIEADVKEDGFDKLMTGYFYEVTASPL